VLCQEVLVGEASGGQDIGDGDIPFMDYMDGGFHGGG